MNNRISPTFLKLLIIGSWTIGTILMISKHSDGLAYLSFTVAFTIFLRSQRESDATDQKLEQILKELKELKECNSMLINYIKKLKLKKEKNTHPKKEIGNLNISLQKIKNKDIKDIKRGNPHGKRTDKN